MDYLKNVQIINHVRSCRGYVKNLSKEEKSISTRELSISVEFEIYQNSNNG